MSSTILVIVAALVFLVALLVPDVRVASVAGLILSLAVLAPHLH